MLNLGLINFLNPWVLSGLLALPLIWWLLRVTPPRPKRVTFPAIRFLLDLKQDEQSAAHTPWWLVALRMVISALIILAFSEPIINPEDPVAPSSVLIIVIDDGWPAAHHWEKRKEALSTYLDEAERTRSPVLLLSTASTGQGQETTEPRLRPAAQVKGFAQTLVPKPWLPKRTSILPYFRELDLKQGAAPRIIWLSDGLDYGHHSEFFQALGNLGDVTVHRDDMTDLALTLLPPEPSSSGLEVHIRRPSARTKGTGRIKVVGDQGRFIGNSIFSFNGNALESIATVEMPLELRNDARMIAIDGMRAAGSVALLDARWRRQLVGLAVKSSTDTSQPLLSQLFYLERALDPYTEIRKGPVSALLEQNVSVLMVADIGQFVGDERDAVADWVNRGGLLVQFAGPHMAAGVENPLLPVPLRQGDRALGGALSWEEPQRLAPFTQNSPFFGLAVPQDVTVTRQVLAQPSIDLPERTWASLSDGTPLVTSAPHGQGRLVLFHVTANPDWSNLALSGLYVEMLRRVVHMSSGLTLPSKNSAATDDISLRPLKTLNGFGELRNPEGASLPISSSAFGSAQPGPRHPPGFYGNSDISFALNATNKETTLKPLKELPSSFIERSYISKKPLELKALFLIFAFLLILCDGVIALALSGRFSDIRSALSPLKRRGVACLFWALLCLPMVITIPALAQENAQESGDNFALKATLETPLAYVITGNAEVDNMSAAGLRGLTRVLTQRTAMEPAPPMGVNVEHHELAFFPLLYWPITPEQPALSAKALAKIDAYMKGGGTIFFDSQDHETNIPGFSQATGNTTLQKLLGGLDIPPLEPVPATHVLTKAFYLLQDFPGRWSGGRVWVEASNSEDGAARRLNNDGVSAIIIGSNDYAAAWAEDESGRPLAALVPGGRRQREMAQRFGVNLLMYVLTGNYKADQVHVPALLERLGQ